MNLNNIKAEYIAVNKLHRHPNYTRLHTQKNVIDSLCNKFETCKEKGVMENFPPLQVRCMGDDTYQIIDGHLRYEAAKKFKIEELPCWIGDMTDDEAVMSLIKSNIQSPLKTLEIGLHALNYVKPEQGRNDEGIKKYAKEIGKTDGNVHIYISGAKVFTSYNVIGSLSDESKQWLSKKAHHLSFFSKLDGDLQAIFVDALLKNQWSIKKTEDVVKAFQDLLDETPAWAIIDPDEIAVDFLNKQIITRLHDDLKNLINNNDLNEEQTKELQERIEEIIKEAEKMLYLLYLPYL